MRYWFLRMAGCTVFFFTSHAWSAEHSIHECSDPDITWERAEKIAIPAIHTVRRGEALFRIAQKYGDSVNAIKKRNKLASDKILPGNRLFVNVFYVGRGEALVSWYGDFFHGKMMANGKPFNMNDQKTVAHKRLPFGTKVLFRNPRNGKRIEAIVRDRGPYIKGREFDLSYAAAKKLGIAEQGVVRVKFTIVCLPKI